jgi:hypothetical protein
LTSIFVLFKCSSGHSSNKSRIENEFSL